jgi:shikimate kinase
VIILKKIYIIGGTMGAGKTTIGLKLNEELPNSVFLDGDWCWYANPFQVTEETKKMVLDNICHQLNNFIHCSAYENIIFTWVMHEQSIIDAILNRLETMDCDVKCISLIVDEKNLKNRLIKDLAKGIRSADVIDRSLARIPMYESLSTIKIDTCNKSLENIINEIKSL